MTGHARDTAAGRTRPSPLAQLARSAACEGGVLFSRLQPAGAAESIAEFLLRSLDRLADAPVYRVRQGGPFVDVTWSRVLSDAAAFGSFLRSRGVGRGDRVAVLSRNRGEMLVSEFAVMSIGAVCLPIFAGYTAEQSRLLVADSGAAALVVSDLRRLAGVAPAESVRLLVHMDPPDGPAGGEAMPGYRGELVSLARAMQKGGASNARAFLESCAPLDPREPCLMMYTSGTMGNQKGVILCHDNILSQRRALERIWDLGPRDRLLSYLPWHHSFGGIFEKYTALFHGAPIAIDESYGKDFALLLRNWREIRPTVYFSVPAIFQRLVDHVQQHPQEESEIFHPELKFVFTAAAPLPANLSAFFESRGIPVLEGWGLTETSPCCTLTDPSESRSVPGVVGYPIPGVKIRLDEDGEILVQGPNVMLGYHANPEATAALLPGDGWFRTGDVGEFAGNALRLVARKDRIFKLLNGERIVPTPLENWLAGRSPYIRHVVVAGSGRDSLSVLIFPNLPLVEMEFGSDLAAADRAVRDSFRQAIADLNAENPVKYEHIQAFAVISKELSVESNELTPSLKVRFSNLMSGHAGFVEAIYEASGDCDCRFLRKIVRMHPDPRRCFRGKDVTLDRCHECAPLLTPEPENG